MTFENVTLRTNFDNPLTLTETGVGDKSTAAYYLDIFDEDDNVVLELSSEGVSPAITVSYVSPSNIISILISEANINDVTKFNINQKYYADLKRVETTKLFINRFEFIVKEGFSDNP